MQLSPFLRCLDCGVCVAIRLVRFGYNPSTGRIALRVAPISPFPLAREPTVTAWRGTTLGRDITNAISLIVPLRFVRRLRNNMAQSLVLVVKSDARFARRRCGSCSVFEVAKSVNKNTSNRFSFWAQSKNFVIASDSVAISWERNDKLFCARATIINYQFLRCLIASYSTMPAATDALRELTFPNCGMVSVSSQSSLVRR